MASAAIIFLLQDEILGGVGRISERSLGVQHPQVRSVGNKAVVVGQTRSSGRLCRGGNVSNLAIIDPPKSLGPLLIAYNTTLPSLLDKHAPIVTKLSRRHYPSNPCFTPTLRAFRSTLRHAENLWKHTDSAVDWPSFKSRRNQYHKLILSSKKSTSLLQPCIFSLQQPQMSLANSQQTPTPQILITASHHFSLHFTCRQLRFFFHRQNIQTKTVATLLHHLRIHPILLPLPPVQLSKQAI